MSQFTALVREGWLQYRPESTGMKLLGRSWKVGWFELLADGKLSWFPSPDKRHHENRSALLNSTSPAPLPSLKIQEADQHCSV